MKATVLSLVVLPQNDLISNLVNSLNSLNGDSEEIFDLYRENDWDTLKTLSAVQKEKLALVLYQENYAVEANLLLED